MSRRALIVSARNPWPARRGDQMRALHFARALHELGFLVDLFVSDRGPAGGAEGLQQVEWHPPRPADRLRGLASVLRGAPLQTLPFRSKALETAVLERMGEMHGDDVVLVQLVRHAPLIERLSRQRRPEGPTLLVDLIDVLSVNFQRRAEIDGPVRGLLWRQEARRLERAERDVVRQSDAVTVVCERDREELVRLVEGAQGKARTTPLPIVDSAGAAVPRAIRPCPGRPRLAFTGNLGYFVNDHAIRGFLGRVWPVLSRRRPGLELVVAGARPGSRLRAACARAGAILQPDPADLRQILRTADLALAPLVGGAGVPVKVLEAWSEGVPVVASEWCARGLLAESERLESIDACLFRVPDIDDAEGFAGVISTALEDADGARARAQAARTRLERLHSFEAFRHAVDEFIRIGRRRQRAG